MKRFLRRQWRKVGPWPKVALLLLTPLCALNLSVATLGKSAVSPLSPFFLREKAAALGQLLTHLPACAWHGHPENEALIRAAEAKHRLPRGLFRAVIQVESEGRPHRISPAGAMGLAQLMPATARELGVTDPFDSRQSIDAGARYLSRNLRRLRSVPLAVAAYNAGPGAVQGGIPRNGETEFYVRKVMRAYQPKARGARGRRR